MREDYRQLAETNEFLNFWFDTGTAEDETRRKNVLFQHSEMVVKGSILR